MFLNPDIPAAIAAAENDSALEPESLNSERIEHRFGSCGIDVLEHRTGLRRSSLFSVEGDRKICRTLAVVIFEAPQAPDLIAAHAMIIAGQSIGATLKSSGCEIRKSTLYAGTLSLRTTDQAIHRLMQLDGPAKLALHAYRLEVRRGEESFEYATIVEIHHPDYLSPSELKSLYCGNAKHQVTVADINRFRALALGAV